MGQVSSYTANPWRRLICRTDRQGNEIGACPGAINWMIVGDANAVTGEDSSRHIVLLVYPFMGL